MINNRFRAWVWVAGPTMFVLFTTILLMGAHGILHNVLSPLFGLAFALVVVGFGILISGILNGILGLCTKIWRNVKLTSQSLRYEYGQRQEEKDQ